MIAEIDLKVGIDFRVRTSPDFRLEKTKSRKLNFRNSGIIEVNRLIGLLPFVMVLLSCIMAPLGAKSLSDLLKTTKPC